MAKSEMLSNDWEPVLIHIEKEAFTGLSYDVPGWKCKRCGAQYGTIKLPTFKCWKCEEKLNLKGEGG